MATPNDRFEVHIRMPQHEERISVNIGTYSAQGNMHLHGLTLLRGTAYLEMDDAGTRTKVSGAAMTIGTPTPDNYDPGFFTWSAAVPIPSTLNTAKNYRLVIEILISSGANMVYPYRMHAVQVIPY